MAALVHIGEKIQNRIQEIGISKSEFARRINKARQNIEIIIQKKSIDTQLLLEISKALDHDFFQHYYNHNYSTNIVNDYQQLRNDYENLKREHNDLLKKYVDVLENKVSA